MSKVSQGRVRDYSGASHNTWLSGVGNDDLSCPGFGSWAQLCGSGLCVRLPSGFMSSSSGPASTGLPRLALSTISIPASLSSSESSWP